MNEFRQLNDRMSARINLVVAALATIALTILVPDDTARADVLGCDDSNRRCIDDLYSASCAERQTTRETCEALGREAEAVWSTTRSSGAGELLGLVYYRLADLASRADDDLVESNYLQRAREVYLAVVEVDEESYGGHLMLAVLDSENPDQYLAWMRKAVAIDPSPIHIRFLTTALMNQGTVEAFIETIDLLQDQYDAAPPGIEKWHWAGAIHSQLSFAALAFDFAVDADSIAELQARVSRDSDWDQVLATLSSPSARAEDVSMALETACRLTAVYGDEPCTVGIERTVLAARDPSERNAQVLADAAAQAIRIAPWGYSIIYEENEDPRAIRRQWATWLNEFANLGLDSVPVLQASERLAETADRRLEVREEIVRREPGNGEARMELGASYFGKGRWAEAIDEFERARELAPEYERYLIDSYLREARYERDAASPLL